MVPFKKDPLDENCRDWAYRPVPMYWPHEVLHYMFESVGIKIPETKLKEYWAQARHYKLPWAKGSEDDTSPRIPVKLFGDDARYNQQGDKLLAFIISCPLWRPASGRAARWPVAVVSLHGNLGFPTMQPLLHEIVWSLNQAFDVPSRTGLLFQCTELGGDWKYHRESLNLQCHWNSESMCHLCSLPRHRFPEFPEPLPDRTFVQFVNDALEPGWPSPLILLRRFHLSVLQWCLLHTVHLGLLWTANGGCIDYLLQLGVFGNTRLKLRVRLNNAYDSFLSWRKRHRVPATQRPFTANMIYKKANGAYMSSKGWNARVLCAWLSEVCLATWNASAGDDEELLLLTHAMLLAS